MKLPSYECRWTLLAINQHWFKPLIAHYHGGQCWTRSMSPYGVTRPQWVNSNSITCCVPIPGLILGLHPASERRCYKVTLSHWLGTNLKSSLYAILISCLGMNSFILKSISVELKAELENTLLLINGSQQIRIDYWKTGPGKINFSFAVFNTLMFSCPEFHCLQL